MSQYLFSNSPSDAPEETSNRRLLTFAVVFTIFTLGLFIASPLAESATATVSNLLGFSAENVAWYITRASGITAYLLVWLSTVWGLAIPSKLFGRYLNGNYTFDFHQFISLLSFAFLGLHMFILLADTYLSFNLVQILVPFLDSYRPLWVGVGVIAFYLLVLVTVTFYMRDRIGMKAFRVIHYSSLVAYLGATAHAIFSGTDSTLPAAMVMYGGTLLVVIFLTVYWLIMAARKQLQ